MHVQAVTISHSQLSVYLSDLSLYRDFCGPVFNRWATLDNVSD